MFRRRQTVLITTAAQSRQSEIHRREMRYLATMAFRVVCFVLAVVVLEGWLRFVGIAIAVIMPWIAVVVANGGPPPERKHPVTYDPGPTSPDGPAVLEADPHRVVDSEGWVDEGGWVHGQPGSPPRGEPAGQAGHAGPPGPPGPPGPAG